MNRDSMRGYHLVLHACYISYAFAGCGFMARHSPTLSEALRLEWYFIWASLFVFGGLVGLVGSSTHRPWSHYIEGIGLMAIFGAMLVYVLALLFAQPLEEESGVNFGLTLLLFGAMTALTSRAIVLRHQIQIREREGKAIRDESN